jgi:hypothetical protein
MDEDLILVAAIGVDAKGDKHPLGLVEGATENAATVQALIDNLVERGLDLGGAAALHREVRESLTRFSEWRGRSKQTDASSQAPAVRPTCGLRRACRSEWREGAGVARQHASEARAVTENDAGHAVAVDPVEAEG